MLKAYKLRLYPNKKQIDKIHINFNNCRFIWNKMLEMQINRYENNKNAKYINGYGMNLLLPLLKKENPWLKKADSTALQEAITQLDTAFTRFFRKLSGYPKFKSMKYSRKSYTTKMNITLVDENHIKLPKLGKVYFLANKIPDKNLKIKRATITVSATGKYYALVLVDTEIKQFSKTNKSVGIDLGLKDLATQSDGIKLPNIRFDKRLAKKKKYWEKRLARRRLQALSYINEQKKIGRDLDLSDFSNYAIAKHNLAKINEKIANQRIDYLHKYTTNLVKKYDVIAIEDLKASNMLKNHKLAQAISNASWRIFRELLSYKTKWYGKELIVVKPQLTTQFDYETGEINKHPLSVRQYTNSLGHVIDKDINAAKNILSWGINPQLRVTK